MTTTVPPRARAAAAAASDAQQDAITHGEGPCLVLAAPGSGKTYVIARRFVRLVTEEGLRPDRVLALAYNRRAADELMMRVEGLLGPIDGDPPVTTYHAWAAGVVRRHGWQLGWPATVRIATEAERHLHLAEALRAVRPRALHNPARPYDAVADVRKHIERCKQELVTPERYSAVAAERLAAATAPLEVAEWERARDLAAVYAALQERYRAAGVVDHDDCIAIAATLLAEVAAVRDECARLRHVMVDEFQDTNSAQAAMVERLVEPHRNVLAVADDDQAIYRFRGASRHNIERFRRRFPGARELRLLVNRRSTPQIVGFSQAVIAAAAGREDKPVVPMRSEGAPVRVVWAAHARDEAQAVVDTVADRLARGARPSSIAVLTHQRIDAELIARRLEAAEIPYVTVGGRDFFRAPEIKAVMALLEAIADPDAGQALMRCCNLPAVSLSNAGRVRLNRALRDHLEPLVDRLRRPEGVPELDPDDAERLRALADMLAALHAAAVTADVRDLFAEAMVRSEFHRLGELPRAVERRQFAANVSRFYELLDEYCAARPDARFDDTLEYLRLLRDAGGEPVAALDEDVDGVVLSTIHSAKGLEWDHVIVGAAAQGRLPTRDRTDALVLPHGLAEEVPDDPGGHREEQRRLFYVAVTRARETLTITWAKRSARDHRDLQRSEFITADAERWCELVAQEWTAPPMPRRRHLPELARDGRLELSYSAIQDYRQCPKRFEYGRLWRMVPTFSADAWYGERLHAVLRDAAEKRLAGHPVDDGLVAALWDAEWRGARGPRGRMGDLYEEGLTRLRAYVAGPLWSAARLLWVEHAFTVVVDAERGFGLVGRVDRLDLGADGVPEVIDYKTGRPRAEDVGHNLQLKVYGAVAARQLDADVVRCSLHWLQTGTAATVTWTRDQLERFQWGIARTFADIDDAYRDCAFPPRPSAFACARCAYRVVCPERSED